MDDFSVCDLFYFINIALIREKGRREKGEKLRKITTLMFSFQSVIIVLSNLMY